MSIRTAIASSIALTVAMIAAVPANAAGVPVIDPTAIAKIRETVALGTKQLAGIQQQVQQVTQLRNTLGQVGPGMISSVLKSAGIDFSGPASMLREVTSMKDQATEALNSARSMKIPGEILNFSAVTNLATGRDAAKALFFYGGAEAMTSDTVNALRARRNSLIRSSAISGYGAAAAMKGQMTETSQIADKLGAQAKAATDLRGDVQTNTATMLAIYGEITKQTAIQAQLLEMEAAKTLGSDATGKAN